MAAVNGGYDRVIMHDPNQELGGAGGNEGLGANNPGILEQLVNGVVVNIYPAQVIHDIGRSCIDVVRNCVPCLKTCFVMAQVLPAYFCCRRANAVYIPSGIRAGRNHPLPEVMGPIWVPAGDLIAH